MAITIDGTNGLTTDNAALKLDSTTLVVDDTNNRVGIGTASPAVALDVSGYARASSGILFGTDTAAANALDDYEEGTWTPAYGDAGGAVGTTTVGGAFYRKIGNLVVATCDITLSSKGTTTGGDLALVRSLPFSGVPNSGIGGATINYFDSLNQNINYITATQQGDSTILLRITTSATSGVSNGTYSGLYATGTRMFITIVYLTP